MKTLMKITILLSLILITGLLSCGKNKNPVGSSSGFGIDKFPHEIGTVWQYQYFHHDLASVVTDTVFVRVDDTTRITDDSLLVYVVTTENISFFEKAYITYYWHIDGDTVTYYRPEADSFVVTQKLVFPLELGANWTTGTSIIDSNEVTGIFQKTVLGKTYQNSYQITRQFDQSEEQYVHYSYVPNIGLIQSSEFAPYINAPNPIWSLISFYEPDSLTLADFPLQVGASWEYRVYNNLIDCFTECYDTCTVSILDSVMDRGGVINENWIFDYPKQELILKNFLHLDTLFLLWHNYPGHFSINFPLTVGKSWNQGSYNYSFVQVVDRQTISTPAGVFENAYLLKGHAPGFEDDVNFYLWIAKNVGIIKIGYSISSITTNEDKTWELKSYKPNNPFPSFTIDHFPNYDGMIHTYEIHDMISHGFDTVIVQVAESSTVAIWNYTKSDTSWQKIVSIEETVAKFFHPNKMAEPYKQYQFPIEIGNSWTIYPSENRSEVLSASSILTPIGRFFPCYRIETNYNCGNECLNREIELVCPDIGIVTKTILDGEHGIRETWRLIDYYNP